MSADITEGRTGEEVPPPHDPQGNEMKSIWSCEACGSMVTFVNYGFGNSFPSCDSCGETKWTLASSFS